MKAIVTSRAAVVTSKTTKLESSNFKAEWDLRILAIARQELQVQQQGTQGSQAQHQVCSKAKSESIQGNSASRIELELKTQETRQTGPMAELNH